MEGTLRKIYTLFVFNLKKLQQKLQYITRVVLYFSFAGEEKFVSSNYVIENMDRHKGGTYICTANNGVGQTASSQIALHVLCK